MSGIVAFALRQRVQMGLLLVIMFVAGTFGLIQIDIDAHAEPAPPLIEIIIQCAARSADEIERYVTVPIEMQMADTPHIASVRTISLVGLSDVKVQFTDGFTYEAAQQRVIKLLSQLPPLPEGAQVQISPEISVGEILRYQVTGPPGYSVMDLKTIEDWLLERRFKVVPGVIGVSGWSGKTGTYDVNIDRNKLTARGLTLRQVLQAFNDGSVNVGGQTADFGERSVNLRGVRLIHSLDDIRKISLVADNGMPVPLSEVADVSVGHQPNLGTAGRDAAGDIVQGVVLMRRGGQILPTIERVEAEIDHINGSGILPPGVRIAKIDDRGDPIGAAAHTVLRNMIVGVILGTLAALVTLASRRSRETAAQAPAQLEPAE
jgi:cobalt-zinc-cadmium resistance protein CzcA